ncbi:MAG TPA: type VI secretion system baseplate subunit TssF [Thermoanaerobaculia bacterium]|nr:type VI secretion system baseplate subunit TssF [Thermoanaerobaculia bacterium]
MREELLGYYERELSFLRQLGAEFAQKFPKIAGRLLLEPERCEDPHVERMIEAAAFLASRVHLKIDDEFPELTESLLNVLYPNFLAPVPSLSIVQFQLDAEQANLRMGHTIPRGSIVRSEPVDGSPCRFQTCYPVTIWPLEVSEVRFELPSPGAVTAPGTKSLLRIGLRTLGGVPPSELRQKGSGDVASRAIESLRFSLQGEGKIVYSLYELLMNDVLQVELRSGSGAVTAAPTVLPPGALRPVGFEREESVLPYTDRSFLGYRLLQEYFAFPEKYLFFDVTGLERLVTGSFEQKFDLVFSLRREFPLEKGVIAQNFRLHCTPIVNLFSHVAEPIRVTHLQSEYRVIPDVGRQTAMEVYSVDEVSSTRADQEKPIVYEPFYSIRHAAPGEEGKTFWNASRRPSGRDDGTEVYLTLVDLGFRPSVPDVETLTVRVTCSNRDLPGRLPFASSTRGADFELEGAGVFTAIRCLRKPTNSLRTPLRRGTQWRLISHLSLNYLSLVENSGGSPEALQEILKLYDFADSSATRQQISGIMQLGARRVLRPVGSAAAGFVRGIEVSAEFDETQFIGAGVYLFAAVLERFLALYSSVNSFCQLVVSTRQREGILKRWPPRAGEQIVL